MSFFNSFVTASARNLQDSAIKALAAWDPTTVGEAQLTEWNNKAAELATIAVKAAAERDTLRNTINTTKNDIARYTAAAEKLQGTNDVAANKAVDQALALKTDLGALEQSFADADAWATETRTTAESAEQKVATGRKQIEDAKRELARSAQAKTVAEERLHDKERVAGITNNLSGTDVAINALKAGTEANRNKAAAANLRAGVLGHGSDSDDAVQKALAEVDGNPTPKTLADKLAALKS
jgi:chromosome segregation ATPase